MRVLIAGGTGFIGAHLARRLLDAGHDVASYDLADPKDAGRTAVVAKAFRLRTAWLLAGATIIQGDVADRERLQISIEGIDPDCIYYLAALPLVGPVDANPVDAIASMSVGLTNCLDIVRASHRSRRFVYVSSSMVYGHFAAASLAEDAATAPTNLYGGLKLAGEILTRAYLAGTRHEAVVVRPSGVYGPTDFHGRVVQKCCEAAINGEPFIAINPDSTSIDFTCVRDVVAGLALAAMEPGAAGETFNLTYGRARSLSELVDVVSRRSGNLSVVRTHADPGNRPRRGSLDISKARRLLGYAPAMDLERGVAWYLQFLSRFPKRDVAAA